MNSLFNSLYPLARGLSHKSVTSLWARRGVAAIFMAFLQLAILQIAAGAWAAEKTAEPAIPAVAPTVSIAASPKTLIEIDRKISSLKNSRDLLWVLIEQDTLRASGADAQTIAFMRDRFVGSTAARNAGLSTTYLEWFFQAALRHGDRMNVKNIPDFELLPAAEARSWPQIWKRSFDMSGGGEGVMIPAGIPGGITSGSAVIRTTPGVTVRLTADPNSRAMGQLPAGTAITIVARSGQSLLIEGNGVAGFVGIVDVMFNESHLPGSQVTADSRRDTEPPGKPAGRWTQWGWIE